MAPMSDRAVLLEISACSLREPDTQKLSNGHCCSRVLHQILRHDLC